MYHVYSDLSISATKTPARERGGDMELLLFPIEFFPIIHVAQPISEGNADHDAECETEPEPESERRRKAKAESEAEGDESAHDGGMKHDSPKDETTRNAKQQRKEHQVDLAEAGKEAARESARDTEDEADERTEHEPDLRRSLLTLFEKLTLLAHEPSFREALFLEEKALFKEHS